MRGRSAPGRMFASHCLTPLTKVCISLFCLQTTTTHPLGGNVSTPHRQNVAPITASEPGALDGFEMTCTCGTRMTHLFERSAQALALEHRCWHNERDYFARMNVPDPQIAS